jgi:ABC-type uncharacterized transport system substrate-binding protein
MIARRTFLCGLTLGALSLPLVVEDQQAGKVARLGLLRLGPVSANAGRVEALRTGLREHGYVEGKNIVIEYRYAETADQLSELAAELVRLDVDVIFAISSTEVEPVRRATKTIPIVFATHADPVGLGHVASLARPGGNITGLSSVGPEIVTKALEITTPTLVIRGRACFMSNWPTAVFNAMEAFKDDFLCITMDQRNANGGESTGPIPASDPGTRSRTTSWG